MILSLADHSQFREPCCGKSLRKWDCLYFSNHIQLGVLPTVENAVKLSGLVSSRIKKTCLFKDHSNVLQPLGSPKSNKTSGLGYGVKWLDLVSSTSNKLPPPQSSWTWNWIELSPSGCSRSKLQQFPPCASSRNNMGEACRFQNQEHPGTSSSWAIYLHFLRAFPKQKKCARSTRLTFQEINKGLTEMILIARNSERK